MQPLLACLNLCVYVTCVCILDLSRCASLTLL